MTLFRTLPPLPAGTDRALAARLDAFAAQAHGALSESTIRALRADTAIFLEWCQACGRRPLPASSGTVAHFVDAMAEAKAPASVRRYRSSIALLHRAAGYPSPCDAAAVRLALKRMDRAKGILQKQAEPLTRQSVSLMIGAEAPDASDLIGLRDAALLAVAYDTLLRRSELVALRIEDLVKARDGSATILVRRAKDRQASTGAVKFLAPDTVAHVTAYLGSARLRGGPLFRPISKAGRAGDEALQAQEVGRLFAKLTDLAGVKLSSRPSGHSTRVGAAQDMLAAGLGVGEVMQAGCWTTPVMVARYGERFLARGGAARKLATLQNRS